MTPFYEHGGVTLWQGDSRDILASLPAESVQTCVTSPPYYGLRDYGTAVWEGGDATCDHRQLLGGGDADAAKQLTSAGTQGYSYRDVCGKCGARRIDAQIGLEQSPDAYVAEMVAVFREVRRVLREDGTLWLNLGSSYAASGMGGNPEESSFRKQATNAGSLIAGHKPPAGFKPKDDLLIPYRTVIALQEDGWYVRSTIVWAKPNPMPESVTDRPTRSHEYIFLLTKSARYYYDAAAIAEPCEPPKSAGANSHANVDYVPRTTLKQDAIAKQTYVGFNDRWRKSDVHSRNKRDVWTIATAPYAEAHFATFPPKLIEPCILAGCPAGGTVLDPFAGAGTTLLVAKKHNRKSVGIELSADYCDLIVNRLAQSVLPLQEAV